MVLIRKAAAADAGAICEIHQAAARELARGSYSPDEIEAWVGALTPASYASVLREREMVVAEEGGSVIAFGQLDPATGEIEAIYVSPPSARKGAGRAVLGALEKIAAGLGLTHLHLRATLNAVPFYESAGYVAECEVAYRTAAGPVLRVVSMGRQLE